MVTSYQRLVQQRKQCNLCEGLCNPSDLSHAHLDSNEIGPWSRWQGTIPADLMIVGQDWGDVSYYVTNRGRDQAAGNPTNENLARLLGKIGFDPGTPGQPKNAPLFFTNFVLCLKEDGGLQGPVQDSWFKNCGAHFFRALVDIVRPRAIVTLGIHASRAVMTCYGLPVRPISLKHLMATAPLNLGDGHPVLFPVYHCGARSVNMNRSFQNQQEDWATIGAWLQRGRLT